jgi:hypothetical protein
MIKRAKQRQPWLHSALFDSIYILLPSFIALIITIVLPDTYKSSQQMPLFSWVVLILLIDVSHVYSTLFRTYWDKDRFSRHKTLFVVAPITCYVVGVLLYSIDALIFWRILAYLAVFHFIRQQYGIMRLYSRYDSKKSFSSIIDTLAIYAATLYPIMYWHFTDNRNFSWFIDGDFMHFAFNNTEIKAIALFIYIGIIACYMIKEARNIIARQQFNLPKNIFIAGTFLSWYFGIVYFNGDMSFTLLNVVSHGIPYMALIWIFRKQNTKQSTFQKQSVKITSTFAFFLISIFILAYVEEGVWDGLIWRERNSIFDMFWALPSIEDNELLAVLIPLLSLPQSTHYVLDGFIWKRGK